MAEFWSNNDRGYRIKIKTDQISQDTNQNTSQVRVVMTLFNTGLTFAQYSCTASITIDGQTINWGGNPSLLNFNSSIMVMDRTFTIKHSSDGTKTASISANFSGSGGYSPGRLTVNGNSITLTAIPVASSFTLSGGEMGSSMAISINRQNDSFKHRIRYEMGSASGVIAENVDINHNWSVPLNLASQVPNSTTGQATIFVDTYQNGNLKGTKAQSINLNVPANVKPTFTRSHFRENNPNISKLGEEGIGWDHFIRVISDIRCHPEGEQGVYGSTITGYHAEVVGRNHSTDQINGTLGAMNFSGQITIKSWVIDSRGRKSNPHEIRVTILDYFAPQLSFDVKRGGSNGSTLVVNRNAKISPLAVSGQQKNNFNLKFYVAEGSSQTFTQNNGQASGSMTSTFELVNSLANLGGSFPGTKSYTVKGVLSDMFTSTEFLFTVSTEKVVMSYDRSGVGINKVREKGALDVAGDIYANGQLIQQHSLTANDGRAIGDYRGTWETTRTGFYIKGPYDSANPDGDWGMLQNIWSDTFKTFQMYFGFGGRIFTRQSYNANAWKWTNWREFVMTDQIHTEWKDAGAAGSKYKRVGDVLTIKYNFTGNGSTMLIARLPSNVFVADQEMMLLIADWSVDGRANTHVQINANTSDLNALATKNGTKYSGQLTIMI